MKDPSLSGFVNCLVECREIFLAFGLLDQLLQLLFYLSVFCRALPPLAEAFGAAL